MEKNKKIPVKKLNNVEDIAKEMSKLKLCWMKLIKFKLVELLRCTKFMGMN